MLIPIPLRFALVFLFIAFAPITAAEHGFDPLPHWVGAWCLIISFPAALISIIGLGEGAPDER